MQQRIENIDMVRAIAIIAVIYDHTCQMLLSNTFTNNIYYYFNHHGVTISFVLSGFLVGRLYLRDTKQSPKQFWLSRFLRTYPPYLVMLLISWLAVYVLRQEKFNFGYLFFWQNFFTDIPFFLVSWSLAVQEHFYLLFSLLIFCIKNQRVQIAFWLTLMLLAPILRYNTFQTDATFGYNTTATFLHIDSLAMGVLTAYLSYYKTWPKNIYSGSTYGAILLIMLIAFLISDNHNLWNWSVGISLLNLTIATLIWLAYHSSTTTLAKQAFIKHSARMGYSLYLVHAIVIHLAIYAADKLHITNTYVIYPCTIAAIYTAAWLFYQFVELKSIKFRKYILKKNKQQNFKLSTITQL